MPLWADGKQARWRINYNGTVAGTDTPLHGAVVVDSMDTLAWTLRYDRFVPCLTVLPRTRKRRVVVVDLTSFFKDATSQLANWIEIAAAVIIGLAATEATLQAVSLFFRRHVAADAKEELRLRLGRWLAVALEFELAADILRTAIAPTLREIELLAAIAAIRTALNYFLQKEIERAAQQHQRGQTEEALGTQVSAFGGRDIGGRLTSQEPNQDAHNERDSRAGVAT